MSFATHQALFLIIGTFASIALLIACFGQFLFQNKQFYAKRVITPFEQKMFVRLNETFPHYYVLAQVAFSALINAEQYKFRAKFNRKVTDFVLLDHDMQVIAIIELDDPSHIGKEQEDAQRDAMLTQAGHLVFRYTNIPSARELKKDIAH